MSQLSQSRAASRAKVVADDVHAAPSTTSAPTSAPTSIVRGARTRRTSGIESAAASARAPTAIAAPPSSVAGHPTPATVTAAAESGRRAATSSPTARVKPKIGAQHESVHLGIRDGLEGQEDLVEVDDAAADVPDDRGEHLLVAERQELPGLCFERDPGCPEGRCDRRSDPPGAAGNEGGQDGENRDGDDIHHDPRLLEARPYGCDRERREHRRNERPSHVPPPSALRAESAAARSSPRRTTAVGIPWLASRSRPGSARVGREAKLGASIQTTERLRRDERASSRANAAGSSVAVTATSSPLDDHA